MSEESTRSLSDSLEISAQPMNTASTSPSSRISSHWLKSEHTHTHTHIYECINSLQLSDGVCKVKRGRRGVGQWLGQGG